MSSLAFDNLIRIVSPDSTLEHRLGAMRDFARELDWTPSYEFETRTSNLVTDHLVVEHGLENSAVLSFVKSPHRTNEFDREQLKALLAISYNNLIEWHIFVSSSEIRCVNNLSFPEGDVSRAIDRGNLGDLLASPVVEERLFTQLPRRTYNACDDIFIQLVSRWKRLLKSEYGDRIDNSHISTLFNALIFARACEDIQGERLGSVQRGLLRAIASCDGSIDLVGVINHSLAMTGYPEALAAFLDVVDLDPFRKMDLATAHNLLTDFYRPSSAPYDFNFAWMSKHALSRIYERYISLLEFPDDDDQLSMLKPVPEEITLRRTGSVYTPQFIAGFFARYIRDNTTPRVFRSLRVIDPACGSGMFIRTMLEQRCNPLVPGTTRATIDEAFERSYGIDRDSNATASSRLSLVLLHLVATGDLPRPLNIVNDDAVRLALDTDFFEEKFGAVLANPPYIKLDHLSAADRALFSTYLGPSSSGRVDSYIAFVKLCLDIVEPDGFICLVLPQVFLLSKSAGFLRRRISVECEVRCVVDLTEVPVFEGVGTYNILLILQRRGVSTSASSPAQVARVRGFVGPALQACLDRRAVTTTYYDVFEVGQHLFAADQWILLSSLDVTLKERLAGLRPISTYLEAKQGFVTGADSVFVRRKSEVPKTEKEIYLEYLPDRHIARFAVPTRTDEFVFYPFENDVPISESHLRREYPETWKYLLAHKGQLSARRAVLSEDTPWWRPVRPREPKNMRRPKIVCPHLMLTPRFAVDVRGKFGVSHSPFLIAFPESPDPGRLQYFCAILNSSVVQWYLQTHAPKYARGYNRIEVGLLKSIPVPDPAQVPLNAYKEIVASAESLSKQHDRAVYERLDSAISDLYGLVPEERKVAMGHF